MTMQAPAVVIAEFATTGTTAAVGPGCTRGSAGRGSGDDNSEGPAHDVTLN